MSIPKYRRKPDKGAPVLRGFLFNDRKQITVWCPYCNMEHGHCWDPEAPDWNVEHRVAHCTEVSPFRTGDGYFIGVLPKKFRTAG